MIVQKICKDEAEELKDVICNIHTFETLKNIYKNKSLLTPIIEFDLNKKIQKWKLRYDDWWTKILNFYNIPFYRNKIMFLTEDDKIVITSKKEMSNDKQ